MKLVLVGFCLTALTVIIHCAGMYLSLVSGCKIRGDREVLRAWRAHAIMIVSTSLLLMAHIVEVILWAGYYYIQHLFNDMTSSVYFSMTSYSTVGYGDLLLPHEWRMLGPIEAVVGVLMLGWSTATLFAIVQKTYRPMFNSLLA